MLKFNELGISDKEGIQYLLALAEFINSYLEGVDQGLLTSSKHGWSIRKNPTTQEFEFVSNHAFKQPFAIDKLALIFEQHSTGYKIIFSFSVLKKWYTQFYKTPDNQNEALPIYPFILTRAVDFFNHFIFPTIPDRTSNRSFTTPIFCKKLPILTSHNTNDQFSGTTVTSLAENNTTPSRSGHYEKLPSTTEPAHGNIATPSMAFSLPTEDTKFLPLGMVLKKNDSHSTFGLSVELPLIVPAFSSTDKNPYFALIHEPISTGNAANTSIPYVNLSFLEVKRAYIDLFVQCGIAFKFLEDSKDSLTGKFQIDAIDLITFYQKYLGAKNHISSFIGCASDATFLDDCLSYCSAQDTTESNTPYLIRIASSGLKRPGYCVLHTQNTKTIIFCNFLEKKFWEGKKISGVTSVDLSEQPKDLEGLANGTAMFRPIYLGSLSLPVDETNISDLTQKTLQNNVSQNQLLLELQQHMQSIIVELMSSNTLDPAQRDKIITNLQVLVGVNTVFASSGDSKTIEQFKNWVDSLCGIKPAINATSPHSAFFQQPRPSHSSPPPAPKPTLENLKRSIQISGE
ncbi:MAG: hypothetical protein JSS53_05600 [Proteobacteria bacterium]|nr:hypothetical protein [Pseudomonadota bacterium]